MMLIFFLSNTCFIAPMDRNVIASETHYFNMMNCFDLNEPLQEGIIILFYL